MNKLLVVILLCCSFSTIDACEIPSYSDALLYLRSGQNFDLLCEYYQCKEQFYNCGRRGYFVSIGEKYCQRFSISTFQYLSNEGQQWLASTLVCLQQYFESSSRDNLSCQEAYQLATGIHSNCYLKAPFCDLKSEDIIKIFQTIDKRDFRRGQLIKEALEVIRECLRLKRLNKTKANSIIQAIEQN